MHGLLVEAVHRAQARGEVQVLHVDAHVLGHVAAAAQEQRPGVEVQTLDAAVRALHQRVVLGTDAEAQGQLRSDVPAVPDVERELVLAPGHLDLLEVLRVVVGKPEHEGGEAVPARRRVAGRAGRVAAEAEAALEAVVAELGLEVVQLEAHEVEAGADLVLGQDLRDGRAEGPVLLRAEQGHPARRAADRVGAGERRQAAVALGAAVDAGDPELGAVVGAVVGAGHRLVHAAGSRSCRRARGSG